jgi:hypothetical protein
MAHANPMELRANHAIAAITINATIDTIVDMRRDRAHGALNSTGDIAASGARNSR